MQFDDYEKIKNWLIKFIKLNFLHDNRNFCRFDRFAGCCLKYEKRAREKENRERNPRVKWEKTCLFDLTLCSQVISSVSWEVSRKEVVLKITLLKSIGKEILKKWLIGLACRESRSSYQHVSVPNRSNRPNCDAHFNVFVGQSSDVIFVYFQILCSNSFEIRLRTLELPDSDQIHRLWSLSSRRVQLQREFINIRRRRKWNLNINSRRTRLEAKTQYLFCSDKVWTSPEARA